MVPESEVYETIKKLAAHPPETFVTAPGNQSSVFVIISQLCDGRMLACGLAIYKLVRNEYMTYLLLPESDVYETFKKLEVHLWKL